MAHALSDLGFCIVLIVLIDRAYHLVMFAFHRMAEFEDRKYDEIERLQEAHLQRNRSLRSVK